MREGMQFMVKRRTERQNEILEESLGLERDSELLVASLFRSKV
jgi:hypothetical protein